MSRRLRRVSLLAAALMFVPIAANADMETTSPEVDWGIEGNALMVQAPRKAWGTRHVLEYIDNQLPNFIINYGKCAGTDPCLKVYIGDYGATGWFGVMSTDVYGNPYVKYNEYYIPSGVKVYAPARHNIACHEILHALGMPHHEGDGCLPNRQPLPSESELEALRAYYQ